jgi:RNA recognition motif-containing protein
VELPDADEETTDGQMISGAAVRETPSKLFVGNLPFDCDADDLAAAFGAAGKVVKAMVPRDFDRKRQSRGYGFVVMESVEAAKNAKRELAGMKLGGRTIQVEWARS